MTDQYNQIKLTFTTNNVNKQSTIQDKLKMTKNYTNDSCTNFTNKKPKTVLLSKTTVQFDISLSMWCAEKNRVENSV